MSELADDKLKYWIGFNQIPGIGYKRLTRLRNFFPSLAEAWTAAPGELRAAGLEENVVSEISKKRGDIDPDQELEKVRKHKLEVLTINDKTYPPCLREIPGPPCLLYYRGEIFNDQDNLALAVVGTRKASSYGKRATEEIVTELTQAGLVIISGLALGIDATAHRACLQAQGRTIAVFGTGLDITYPASHGPLARKIIDQGGLLISEFPIGTPSYKSNFPQRNRIISGLSMGTLVVEAGESSGSLITAKLALEQNRDVFAVPGPIHSAGATGSNQLIKEGACLVTSGADIIAELNLGHAEAKIENRQILPETGEEAAIMVALEGEPMHIDELIRTTQLDAPKITAILVTMELKGMVKNIGNNVYRLKG